MGILLDRHTRNGTLIVEEGTVTFGNSINNNRDTNVIQDTERSLILQVNPQGRANIVQATTAGSGKTNWDATVLLNGGTLGLNAGDFRGNLNIDGTIEANEGTTSLIFYEVASAETTPAFITIAAPILGGGDLVIQNTSDRNQDRLILSNSNDNQTGSLTLSGGTFLAKNETGTIQTLIEDGTVLGGNGTVGDLTIPETSAIHPGDGNGDIETLSTSEVTLGGELRIDYNSNGSDTLIVDGTLALDGAKLSLIEGDSPAVLGSYTIAEASTITGFANMEILNVPAGYSLELITGGPGQQLVLTGQFVPGNYTEWIAQFPGLSPADAQLDADPDQNGFDNIAEFVLNSDPTQFEPEKAPQLTAQDGNVLFSFPRFIPAHSTGNRAIIEWTTNLNAEIWNELRLTIASSDDLFDYTSTVIPAAPNAPRVFARMRVTPPN